MLIRNTLNVNIKSKLQKLKSFNIILHLAVVDVVVVVKAVLVVVALAVVVAVVVVAERVSKG